MLLPRSVWIGLAAGIVIGGPPLYLSFITTFGVCSDTSISETLFPYALAADPTVFAQPLLGLALALIQFPLYGVLLGLSWSAQGRKLAFLACTMVLFGGHFAAVKLANQRVAASWEYRFSHMR